MEISILTWKEILCDFFSGRTDSICKLLDELIKGSFFGTVETYDILFEAAVQTSPVNSQVCCPLFHHKVHHCRHGNLAMDRLVGGW